MRKPLTGSEAEQRRRMKLKRVSRIPSPKHAQRNPPAARTRESWTAVSKTTMQQKLWQSEANTKARKGSQPYPRHAKKSASFDVATARHPSVVMVSKIGFDNDAASRAMYKWETAKVKNKGQRSPGYAFAMLKMQSNAQKI